MGDLGQSLLWFVAVSAFILMVYALLSGRQKHPTEEGSNRPGEAPPGGDLDRWSVQQPAASMDPKLKSRLRQEEKKAQMQKRMIQAGLYKRNAIIAFATARVVLVLMMVGLGVLVGTLFQEVEMPIALAIGATCGLAGTIVPSFWLDHVKRNRQTKVRRSLPDALDVLCVCLEGGLSLSGALVRVASELGTAHPLLAMELAIVERETQMGLTTGEAMQQFADRFELEELRSLASVIRQTEKMGGGVTQALQVYAETLREKRFQRAQELGQKAAIKILFPTLFCIFPGLFVVILGPAAIQIWDVLDQAKF